MFPKTIEKEYFELEQFISGLYLKWNIFQSLFLKDQKRIDFLNHTASTFFAVVSHSLLKDIIISISQLVDNHKVGSNRNLSLHILVLQIPEKDKLLKKKLEQLRSEIVVSATYIRALRSKYLAHLDYNLFKQNGSVAEFTVNKIKITNLLNLISDYMNEVSKHYKDTEVLYEFTDTFDFRSADALIYWLKLGVKLNIYDFENPDLRIQATPNRFDDA
ncbi:MAG: phage hypothetical protein [Bacteroidetes bacterium HLUCCA01]|nr:MAG: phage hypothetical protein [Bacteroidetes bacterium HLUCCA01]